MGRILRAHLFVEHYLTRYLQTQNPNLGDLDEARISFAQKLGLVGQAEKSLAHLLPGIRRLNAVRNRISHTLKIELTPEDSRAFLSITLFQEYRKRVARPKKPNDDPVRVVEDFAKYAGIMLEAASNPDRLKWAEAMKDVRD